MILRWRTISSGYYDYQIGYYVLPMTLQEAAINIDRRHKTITKEDQHIEKKSLDGYYSQIKMANDPSNPFDFSTNKYEDWRVVRRHLNIGSSGSSTENSFPALMKNSSFIGSSSGHSYEIGELIDNSGVWSDLEDYQANEAEDKAQEINPGIQLPLQKT